MDNQPTPPEQPLSQKLANATIIGCGLPILFVIVLIGLFFMVVMFLANRNH